VSGSLGPFELLGAGIPEQLESALAVPTTYMAT
jgi:hypothetical protein